MSECVCVCVRNREGAPMQGTSRQVTLSRLGAVEVGRLGQGL